MNITFQILILLITCKSSFCNVQAWTVWNAGSTIRFGFINRLKTSQQESVHLCKSAHFENLITVRSRQELNEIEKAIEDYEKETTKLQQFASHKINHYWLGTIAIKSNNADGDLLWKHYDKTEERNVTSWFSRSPKKSHLTSCVVIQRECAKNCSLKWQSRKCDDVSDISAVICESRENRIFLEEVENEINFGNDSTSYNTKTAESLVNRTHTAVTHVNLNVQFVSRAVRALHTVAQRSIEVEYRTILPVLRIVKKAEDFSRSKNGNLSTDTKETAVKSLEMFLNRLKPPSNQLSPSISDFSVTTIIAQVRFINGNSSHNEVFCSQGDKKISIVVSKDAIRRGMNSSGIQNGSRVTFVHYKNSELFPSSYNVPQVISAQVNGQHISGLKVPVYYSIPLENLSSNDIAFVQCGFWNFTISAFSNKGCRLRTRGLASTCACDHMTNFALLVELFQRPTYYLFDVINRYIGIISCMGFFLVCVIYLSFAELRQSKTGPVHINLCLCYGLGYFIFLIGSENREDEVSCLAVTVLTHYFFLAGWFWTFIEAFTMYQLLVRKLKYLSLSYHVNALFVSYVFPLVIVVTNVGITVGYLDRQPVNGFYRLNEGRSFLFNSTYVSNFSCWLTSYSLYFGFLSVGGVIFSLNVAVYVIVLREVTWQRKKVSSTRKESTPMENFYRAVTIGVLLGLVWLLAIPMELFAATKILVEPITYLFSLLIAVQGIVIFYLFCVRHVTARRLWWEPIRNALRNSSLKRFGKRSGQFHHTGSSKSYKVSQFNEKTDQDTVKAISSKPSLGLSTYRYLNYSFVKNG